MHFVLSKSNSIAIQSSTTLKDLRDIVEHCGGFRGSSMEVDCAISCLVKWHSGFFQKKESEFGFTFSHENALPLSDDGGIFIFQSKKGGIFAFVRQFGPEIFGLVLPPDKHGRVYDLSSKG